MSAPTALLMCIGAETGCVDVIVFLTRCDKDASKVVKEDKRYLNMLEENLAEKQYCRVFGGFSITFVCDASFCACPRASHRKH